MLTNVTYNKIFLLDLLIQKIFVQKTCTEKRKTVIVLTKKCKLKKTWQKKSL